MKVSEIIHESITGDIRGDLNALLVSVMASNISSISTSKLVKTLRSQGYLVSPNSILGLLSDHPMIKLATKDKVEFAHVDDTSATGDNDEVEKMKDQVAHQATRAAQKEIAK